MVMRAIVSVEAIPIRPRMSRLLKVAPMFRSMERSVTRTFLDQVAPPSYRRLGSGSVLICRASSTIGSTAAGACPDATPGSERHGSRECGRRRQKPSRHHRRPPRVSGDEGSWPDSRAGDPPTLDVEDAYFTRVRFSQPAVDGGDDDIQLASAVVGGGAALAVAGIALLVTRAARRRPAAG